MTTVVGRGPTALRRIRRTARENPEYGTVLAVVVAWVAVVGLHLGPDHLPSTVGHQHAAHAPPSVSTALPMWTIMCVAMMVPTALPAVRHVGVNSLRWRRQRAIGEFLVGYLGVWTAFGLVALSAVTLVGSWLSVDLMLAVTFGAAAVWQVLPYQRHFLRACHRTVPLPARGMRAAAGCVHFGFRHGRACLGVCGPLMLIMALVVHQSLLWMVLLTVIVADVKLLPRSDRVSGPLAVGLGTFALLFLLI